VKAQELSKKYASAIFSLALEKWLAALNAVQDKLTEEPNVAQSLANDQRSFAERQKELDSIIPADSDQSIRNFFYTLLKNGDINLLGSVLSDLGQMSRGGPLVKSAEVTTAVALSDEEKDQVRQKLRAQYGAGLEFNFTVDPAIIGGAVVQVGDKIIDGSVATRLEAMKNVLGVKI
jgi:F-type H+-transporting ATPase subunit delta